MKKSLPAVFASVLAAAALISTLAGCDYEIELTSGPWPTSVPPVTTLPKTVPPVTTVPKVTVPKTTPVTGPGVTTTPGTDIPYMGKYNPLLCTANADARAAAQDWICLNEYIANESYCPLFDTQGVYMAESYFTVDSVVFDRPVYVYGIELTFVQPELKSFEFKYGDLYIDWFELPYCPGIEITENGNPLLPGNTLWIEAANGKALKRNGGLSFYASPANMARIRFFGVAEPIIEEVRAPSYIPGDVTVREYETATKHTLAYYSNSTGKLIASFEQTTIYGSQKLPTGVIDLIQFAGREVVRVQYKDTEGNVDLYWNDGEYRYNLFGSDEDLLLRLAESIEPRPGI